MILNPNLHSLGFPLQMRCRNLKSSYENILPGNHLVFPVHCSFASWLLGSHSTCNEKNHLSYRSSTARRSRWFPGKAAPASFSYQIKYTHRTRVASSPACLRRVQGHSPYHSPGVKTDLGSRPARFTNKHIHFHQTHLLHCKMGTIIPTL